MILIGNETVAYLILYPSIRCILTTSNTINGRGVYKETYWNLLNILELGEKKEGKGGLVGGIG